MAARQVNFEDLAVVRHMRDNAPHYGAAGSRTDRPAVPASGKRRVALCR